MAYLDVEDGRCIYYERYAGAGRPVVLVHGWGASCRIWDGVLAALLEHGNEVVLLDERCCGRSDKDFRDISVEASGGDLARLVEELELAAPVVSGWSRGAAIAVDVAGRLDGAVAGLVLTAGATPRYTPAPDWPYGIARADVEAMLASLRDARVETLWTVARSVCSVDVGESTARWIWEIFLQASPRIDAGLALLCDLDQRETLRRLDVPVLLVAGGQDAFTPLAAVEAAAGLLRRGRLVAFPECGHAPFLEDPARYRDELLAFVDALH